MKRELKLISTASLNVIEVGNGWFVYAPGDLQIDSNFKNRVMLALEAMHSDHTRIYCGAGVYPHLLGKNQNRLVSFAFDEFNSPSNVSGSKNVLQILESPIAVHNETSERLGLHSENDFVKILALLNLELRHERVLASAHPALMFGLSHRMKLRFKPESIHTRAMQGTGNLKLTVITRTLGSRPEFLQACVLSVTKFRHLLEPFELEHILVIGGQAELQTNLDVDRVVLNSFPDNSSRLGGLIEGLRASTGDLVLFLDDDDELNPEAAATIRSLLTFDSTPRVMFFDSVQVFRNKATGQMNPKLGHRYKALNALASLFGPNRTPISSVIYPRAVFDTIFEKPWSEVAPTVLEDHLVMHWAMSFNRNEEVFIPKVLSFISIHGGGQTITNPEFSIWRDSMSSIRSLILGTEISNTRDSLIEVGNSHRAMLAGKAFRRKALSLVTPKTFRVLRNFRIFSRLRSGQVTVQDLLNKFLNH